MDIETYGRGMLRGVIGVIFLAGVILNSSCHKALPLPEPQYDPRNISRNDTYSVGPSIAVGPDGTVYVVWMDGGHNEYDPSRLYFRYKPSGGEWSEVEILTDTTRDAWAPHIAVDPSNNLHLVWESDDPTPGVLHSEIRYRMRSPSGEWSDVEVLSNPGSPVQPRIAIDPSGTVHVIWNSGAIWYVYKSPNGDWGVPREVVPFAYAGDNPSLAVDSEGICHLVYECSDEICYVEGSTTGEWSERVNVSQSPYQSTYARIAIDENNKPWVLWTENDWRVGYSTGIIYYTRLIGDTWAQPESVPGTRAGHAWPRNKSLFFYGGKKYLL